MANSEVKFYSKYDEIKTGYLIKKNSDKTMERKGEEANIKITDANVLKQP